MSETPWRVKEHAKRFCTNPGTVIPAATHPLEEIKKIEVSWLRKTTKKVEEPPVSYDFLDPLGATGDQDDLAFENSSVLEEIKPRSRSLDNTLEQKHVSKLGFDIELPDFQPWRERRSQIAHLSRPNEPGNNSTRARIKEIMNNLDNAGNNPQNLVKPVRKLSQEFTNLREELNRLWGIGDRVESLNKVVNVTEILQTIPSDSEEFAYYWLQAIDILDIFGSLVYERLLEKTNEMRRIARQNELGNGEYFHSDQIPQKIKEMTTNWFLKVSELNDMIPRFYVESAIIKCLKFLDTSKVRINLERLASMCSRFPSDQSSMFARVYISRIAMHIDPTDRSPHWRLLHDWLQAPRDILSQGIPKNFGKILIQKQNLVIQSISWIVQCISFGAHTIDDLAPLWAYCRREPIDEKIYILVIGCIQGMPSKYLAIHSRQILEMVFSLEDDYEIPLTILGKRYCEYPPSEEEREKIKRSVWLRIANIMSFKKFLACSISWSIFITKFFPISDAEKILEMVIMRLEVDESTKRPENFEKIVEFMAGFLENLDGKSDLERILKNRHFIQLLGMIPKGNSRFLEILRRKFGRAEIEDEIIIELIIEKSIIFGKTLELSKINNLDELLIADCISIINLKSNKDLMKSIEIFIKLRAALGLRQKIVEKLVDLLIDLTLDSNGKLKNGARKSEFLRICITNLCVTIPAIHNLPKRFRCLVKVVQLCLLANFLPQMDSTTRRLIQTLETMSETAQPSEILPFISQLFALLIFIPDPPEKPQLYYFEKIWRFLLSFDAKYREEPRIYGEILVFCLRYLCAMRNAEGAENAVLYAGDLEFGSHVDQCIDNVMAKILSLADEPMVSLMILENIVTLFEIHEEIRSTLRGLLKRAYSTEKHKKRLEFVIEDLKLLGENDENVMQILQKLSIVS
ncbi:unnamed protein product [Caenorhabditis angaria]|uniref:Uncharacterized protein n=1 Tax=Caenorhabditis angaria TaxID=860376 RepID=A0A9P1IC82_9PELO|nr:unnamed protein product [Caenorhabditis angaria]